MNISSKLKRVKAQADHLFLRGERTDVVGELRQAEDQSETLRVLCEALRSSVEKTLHAATTSNEEKRTRKILDSNGADTLKDALNLITPPPHTDPQHAPPPQLLLRDVIMHLAESQQALTLEVLRYDDQVESQVLAPLSRMLREDFTNCAKLKKQLKQVGQDLDTARTRYRNSAHGSSGGGGSGLNLGTTSTMAKVDNYKEEMDEQEAKLEQVKDNYACELFSLLSRERDVCALVHKFLDIRSQFLGTAAKQQDVVLPKLDAQLQDSSIGPVYGCSLNTHLQITKKVIAVPVETCVRRLVEIGLREEGLFRMAGSASKVKRLKGAFDANLITDDTFSAQGDDYHKDYDVHVIAGAFKWYLRELPEPLLTFTLHQDWLDAARTQDRDQRLKDLWSVVKRLPRPNFVNLSYVIQFLSLLTSYQSINKMTSNNIAIVIAPNLIWSADDNKQEDLMSTLGRNMSLGNSYRLIVEQLVEFADYFFDEAIDFGVGKMVANSPSEVTTNLNGSISQGVTSQQTGQHQPQSYGTLPRSSGHRRNVSADFNNKFDHFGGFEVGKLGGECESPKQPQRRKKQAPLPPPQNRILDTSGQGNSSSSSPEQLPRSHHFLPTREAPTPSSHVHPRAPTKDGAVPSTPVPAARLHHSGSIRRPNIEPPKPPINQSNFSKPSPFGTNIQSQSIATPSITSNINTASSGTGNKPPRPVPPSASLLEKSSTGSNFTQTHNLVSVGGSTDMSSSVESSSMSSSLSGGSSAGGAVAGGDCGVSGSVASAGVGAHTIKTIDNSHGSSQKVPIGFEHIDDIPSDSVHVSDTSVVYRTKHHDNLGFTLDDSEEGEGNGRPDLPVSNLSASKIFRKSLENVIQLQASGQPLVLPRHQGGGPTISNNNNAATGASNTGLEDLNANRSAAMPDVAASVRSEAMDVVHGEEAVIKTVMPPIPAVRTIKENVQTSSAFDKPEVAVRHDKPALPEKPPTLPRPALGSRPSSNPTIKIPLSPSPHTPAIATDLNASDSSALEDTLVGNVSSSTTINSHDFSGGANVSSSSAPSESNVSIDANVFSSSVEAWTPKNNTAEDASCSSAMAGETTMSSVSTLPSDCDDSNPEEREQHTEGINTTMTKLDKYMKVGSPMIKKKAKPNKALVTRKITPHSMQCNDVISPTLLGDEANNIDNRNDSLQKKFETNEHCSTVDNNTGHVNKDMSTSDHLTYLNTTEHHQSRRRSKSGGSYATIENNSNTLAHDDSVGQRVKVSDRIQELVQKSHHHQDSSTMRRDTSRSASSDRSKSSVRNSIHALQNQLFRDSTLEQANGQLIIHRKGGGNNTQQSRLSKRNSRDCLSRSMEDLDQGTSSGVVLSASASRKLVRDSRSVYGTNYHCSRDEKNRGDCNTAEQQRQQRSLHKKPYVSRNKSCEMLEESGKPLVAPPEQFQDMDDKVTTPKKPKRSSPNPFGPGSRQSPHLGSKKFLPPHPPSQHHSRQQLLTEGSVVPRNSGSSNRSSRTSSPASSCENYSVSSKSNRSSRDRLDEDRMGDSTDF